MKDVGGTLQAANHLSGAVVDLCAVYRPATPADVGRLDVIGRQAGLDVAAQHFAAATDDLARMDAVWARLRPLVLARAGAEVATQFEKRLTAQGAALEAQNAATMTSESRTRSPWWTNSRDSSSPSQRFLPQDRWQEHHSVGRLRTA